MNTNTNPNYNTNTHHHGGPLQHPGLTGAGVGAGAGAATAAYKHHENHHGANVPVTGPGGTTGTEYGTTGTGFGGSNNHNSNVKTSSGHNPTAQATLGKLEEAVGTVLNSQSLKAKGAAKVAEADAVNNQRGELGQAASLEQDAQLARERADVHGARGNMHSNARAGMNNQNAVYPPTGAANNMGTNY